MLLPWVNCQTAAAKVEGAGGSLVYFQEAHLAPQNEYPFGEEAAAAKINHRCKISTNNKMDHILTQQYKCSVEKCSVDADITHLIHRISL